MIQGFNPEFRRNVWLEFSWQRLVAMPAVLGSVFLLVYIVSDRIPDGGLTEVSLVGFYIIAFIWGTRRSAAALADEVRDRTWDGQRLSALGPWALSWGKLFGSTVFVWYGALICLTVFFLSGLGNVQLPVLFKSTLILLLSAVLGQTIALGACLTFLRKLGDKVRLPVFFSQILGLIAGFNPGVSQESIEGYLAGRQSLQWYGLDFDKQDFALLSLAAFVAWALIGLYRQMSGELQQRRLPWVWLAFLLFLLSYVGGFSVIRLDDLGIDAVLYLPLIPFLVGLSLIYVTLFAEAKNLVNYRSCLAAFRSGELRAAATLLPLWVLTYVIVTLIGLIIMWSLGQGEIRVGPQRHFDAFSVLVEPQWVAACLLFVLRDLGLVLFLNFVKRPSRPDIAALIYLALAYGVMGGISLSTGNEFLIRAFLPLAWGNSWTGIALVALQVAVIWPLVLWRWRRLQQGSA